jgi:hypothetical protein
MRAHGMPITHNGGEMNDGSAWQRHTSQRFMRKGDEGMRKHAA